MNTNHDKEKEIIEKCILDHGKCSVYFLMRKLKLTFNQAEILLNEFIEKR